MADSKVEIQVTANTDEAKRSLADLESAADRAMDAGANSAKKLAKSLDEVSASAKASGNEIRMAAKALGGMAIGLAVNRLTQSAGGDSPTAAYLKGAVGPALTAGLMTKNPYVAAGAAGIGIIDTYFQRKDQGKREASEMNDLADSLEKAREKMQAAKERADGFAGTLDRLGDVSRSTSEREAERAAEIEKRQNAVADATERMAAAEKALRDQAAAIDGPQTEEQKKAADRIREAWAEANQDLQTATAELDRLKDANIEAAKKADLKPLDQRGDGPQLSNLEKLGASFGAATDNLAREGNRIAEESLGVLREISAKTGTASFA